PCDYKPESITLPQTGDYLTADCDGDGVTNEKEKEDGTDPLDPCEFVLAHQTLPTTADWNELDCDGDGVPNEKEKEDGTDPLDPCEFVLAHQTLPPTADWNELDCDGDGVPNEKEKEDGTDPLDPCEFVLAHQTLPTTADWNALDCDGDGVPNEKEKEDGTDPLDPCDYNPDSVTLPRSKEWESLDCDDDGNPNITDPDPLVATAKDDFGSTPAMTEIVIDILANDDFLPNNDPNNLGYNSLSIIGGTGQGTVLLDADTGLLFYTPVISESNATITLIYQVCNTIPDPNVCATATVTIEVGANIIDAVDDVFAGNTDGGTIPGSHVLDNDTINGTPVGPGEVILTSTPTDELTIDPDGSVSIAPGTGEGTYTIEYTICEVADPTNCDSAMVTVVVVEGDGDGKIEVNQLVTPNGDGKNDFLFIRGVKNAKNNTLQIFNRWGVSVYEGQGYNNQNNVFDGRSKGRSTVSRNEYLPAGVYYYIFRYENKQRPVTESGYIYVSK
ncbi:MAG TPA: gliding motility-associated C-terminal domain-containing protein, partial [Arenibacter sp.]|nr:gliding motility-associated C-terminal domain-containing protein [Arenibacter sp.]